MNGGTKFSIVLQIAVASGFYFAVKWMVDQLDPTNGKKNKAKQQAQALMTKLRIKTNVQLTEYELAIASHLVDPESIPVSWNDVAGLDSVVQELHDTIILPIKSQKPFPSQLLQPPKGMLLHGPPGCGKTMVAKATAKEAGMRFINLDASVLTDKDGLTTDNNKNTVVVLGATNRPQDVDKAILRRMPASFFIGLPGTEQRRQIAQTILKNERLATDVDLEQLATLTEGFSGSDIREVCRAAAVYGMRDSLKSATNDTLVEECITMGNFLQAFVKLRESNPASI
ncbi:outer mitochondrial transmembrane helix translocase-like isoform X2 [Daphnia carinata]|uniref:outer mitochondrial transmembrane helix translocase-like isoform X2 n=1 Tax=Daphnia carinata TaxID=120202 RepID=UPI00257A184F|nr:outer mitochondrial transmembrane helix translocase-like isoform X2 [Daphnia carinata]